MSHSLLDQIQDVYARESIKMLIDKILVLETRIQQGNVNVNMDGENPGTHHARTHASKRVAVFRSGADPIDKYEFDWKKPHKFVPSDPTAVPVTFEPNSQQSANQLEVEDPLGGTQDTIDPEGNVTVRGASVKGAMNLGHGAAVINPLSIAGLEMWFDARTIPEDNKGIEFDDPIAQWIDRTKTYTGLASFRDSDETGPLWRERRFRGKVVGAIDCHTYEPTDDVDGDFPSTATSPIAVDLENGVKSYKWFQIVPEYRANSATTITVIAAIRQPLLKTAGVETYILGKQYIPYPPGGTEAGNDVCYLSPWAYSTSDPPAATWARLKVLESGGSEPDATQIGTSQIANDQMPVVAGQPTFASGMGYWQIVTFVLEPVIINGGGGRKAKLVRLNGTDQTIGAGVTVGSQDTDPAFDITQILGPNLEGRHVAVFEGELSLANIQAVESYFSGRDEDWNEHEFAESVEGLGAQYALTLQKDENNWLGFRIDSKGVVRYDSTTNADADRSRLQIKPKVIPTANFPDDPGDDFDNGELVWSDMCSGVMVLLVVVDIDGAGTKKFKEVLRT